MTRANAFSSGAVAWLALCVSFLLIALLLPISGRLVVSGIYKDIFVPLSAASHVLDGHLPSRDFWSPIGPLYAWLQAWPFLMFGRESAVVLVWANAPLALWAGVSCLLFSRGRLEPVAAASLAIAATILCMSPRLPESGFMGMVHLASYNRGGWGLLAAMLPLLCGKSRPSSTEGAIAGFSIALLLMLKISFVAPAAVIFLLAIPRWPALLTAAIPSAVALLGLDLLGILRPYLEQIGDAALAGGSVLRLDRLPETIFVNFIPLATAGILLLMAIRFRRERWNMLRMSLALGVLVGATLQAHDYPSLAGWLALIPALTLIGRTIGWEGPGLLAGVLLSASVWLSDLASIAAHRWASSQVPAVAGATVEKGNLPIWSIAPLGRDRGLAFAGASVLTRGLDFRASFEERTSFADAGETALFFTRAAESVASVVRPEDRILDLGFTTPWPFLLDMPSLRGSPLWIHPGRTISATRDVPLERLASGATVVVLPEAERVMHLEPWTVARYRPELESEWKMVLRTAEISVWRRLSEGRSLSSSQP
jgi:hypothetical protein